MLVKQVKRAACGFRNRANYRTRVRVALHSQRNPDVSENHAAARSKLRAVKECKEAARKLQGSRVLLLVGPAQRAQVDGEPVGRGEGVGVVVAQHPAEPGEGVVLELAGLLVLASSCQGEAEKAG